MAAEGELGKAEFYQQKYLTLRPNDYQARLKLIDYADQLVKKGAGREHLIRLLAETIGIPAAGAEAERPRLRVMLAEQLLLNAQYNAALEQISPLEAESRLGPDAMRVKALASLNLVPARGSLLESTRRTRIGELIPLLEEASDMLPGDATLALAVAQVYREYPSLRANSEQLADDRVDRMVADNPGEPDALVSRYRYRKRFHVEGAIDDLRAAHMLDPRHYETNILLGLESLQHVRSGTDDGRESVVGAAEYFSTAIESNPASSEAYYLLASLRWRQGDRADAIRLLRDADRVVPRGLLNIRFLLADYLISDGEIEEASKLVASIQEAIHSPNLGTAADGIALMSNRLRLLEARLSAGRGDVFTAIAYYSSVANSDNEVPGEGDAARVLNWEAEQEMARLLIGLGRWDQVAQQFAHLANQLEVEMTSALQSEGRDTRPLATSVSLESEHRAARVQAAEAYLKAGQYADAVRQLEIITDHTEAGEKALPQEALETSLLVELSVQLDTPPANRSWEEFQFLARRARNELPESERVALALVQFQIAEFHDGKASTQDVQAEIQRVVERFPESSSIWWIVANAYVELGDASASDAALDRYLALDSVEERRISRRVAFLVETGRASEARAWISAQLSQSNGAVEPLLRRLEVSVLRSEEQSEQALKKARALAGAASDKESLVLAWGIALDQQDWKLAEEVEHRLGQTAADPYEVDYYRAQRMLASFDQLSGDQQHELHRLVSRIRSERPNWHRGAEMEARLAEARGDDATAVKMYELAVALGDRSTATLERLTLHLFRNGEYVQAQEVIDRLRTKSEVLSRGTESLAINTALKQERLADALKLALRSVAEHPDDPARKLWLYHVHLINGEPGEAEIVLSEAADEFPDSEILWKAYLTHLAKNKRRDEALSLLEKVPPSLRRDPLRNSLALARAYEVLGEHTRARAYYQEALRVEPGDSDARLQYANLLLKIDAVAARDQFEEVLRVQPSNPEARRKLAALLAATGEPSAWDRVDDLLAATEGSSDQTDKRLRAVLLTKRGKTSKERAEYCELARRILLGITENSSYAADDIDRLLLAGAYEQEGVLNSDATFFELARSQLRYLRSRGDGDERYGLLYLNFLLRSIDAMAMMEDADSVRTAFIRDAHGVLEQRARELNADGAASSQDKLSLLGLRARLLKSEGEVDEIRIALQEFASQEITSEQDHAVRARLLLGLGAIYSLIGSHSEAEPWYRELMKTAPGAKLLVSKSLFQQGKPEDAVSLLLDENERVLSPSKAASLASLLSTSDSDASAFERAWPAVSGTLEKHADDVQLLMSVAVLNVTRGNQPEAVTLFRKVLDIEPDHTLALNNLATLLGENDGDRPEALRLISHAIRVTGRNPALLDTQGTILLQSGNVEEAISSLEESVASVNVDPRYYFHLAAAYLRAGERGKALDSLEEARRRGLDKTVLTESDRILKKELEAGLGVAHKAQKSAA